MKYTRAPIVEAVLDVAVEARPDFDAGGLKAVAQSLKDDFPIQTGLFQISATMSLNEGDKEQDTTRRLVGYQLTRPQNDMVLTIRVDRWSFSKLTPYDCWESFSELGKRYWSKYKTITNPIRVGRIGVRYVNRIDTPRLVDYEEYFRTFVQLSEALPQKVSGFFMQVQIPLTGSRAHLAVNITPIPSVSEDMASTILDIDIFREQEVPQTEDEIWSVFDNELRDAKNEVFEACITDRARELFR